MGSGLFVMGCWLKMVGWDAALVDALGCADVEVGCADVEVGCADVETGGELDGVFEVAGCADGTACAEFEGGADVVVYPTVLT